ncbi:MAG: bifunctional folylpolyglutamate synthase/dihydrofolate synthase, partial [Verrucomicrobiae bacterium]|nr:bifunctional folylpolyglutamate synthase/dihydrofolate synthase [Verrucomicrobiae bacterium]
MNYGEAIDWLYGTQLFGIKLGLDPVRRLLRELGLDPDRPGCKVLHVAGTNGKGSVCAMSDAILRAQGGRTGLFTSPHLVTFRERIRVDGRMIPEAFVAEGLTRIRGLVADWEAHPTFFEITLALAMAYFAAEGCEAIVLETGMGGRLDATNAITSDVAVITSIGLDHTHILGSTIAAIAGEKAGIIKASRPVLSAIQPEEAAAVIEAAAASAGAPLRWVGADEAPAGSLALAGTHQRANAALAVAAVTTLLSGEVSEEAIASGLSRVDWPARFQRLEGGRVIIDGAHNAHAAAVLVGTWLTEYGKATRATVIFGGVANKDTAEVLKRLAPLADRWIFVKVAS